MNYACAFLALIFLFAAVYWFVGGRRWYTGPLIEAEIDENDSQNERSSNEEVNLKTEKHGQVIQ